MAYIDGDEIQVDIYVDQSIHHIRKGCRDDTDNDNDDFYGYTDDDVLTETIDSSYLKILLSHSSADGSYHTLFDFLDLLMIDDSKDLDSVNSGVKLSVLDGKQSEEEITD